MALVLRTHHDIDNTAYALGIIFGSWRGYHLDALNHLGRQTAQHFLGVARNGGFASVLQYQKFFGAVHLYIAVAINAYQWHLAHHLRQPECLGIRVGGHVIGQFVYIHLYQWFLGLYRYLFQHLHIIGHIQPPYILERIALG